MSSSVAQCLAVRLTIGSDDVVVDLRCQPYQLVLRSEFGTSHSSTSQRVNALIQLSIEDPAGRLSGFGEVGLPPKKKACYLADYADVLNYVTAYASYLQTAHASEADPFAQLPEQYFAAVRSTDSKLGKIDAALRVLLASLDTCSANEHEYSRAARCGLEMAILDCWSKLHQLPLYRFIEPASVPATGSFRKGFYTAAINPSIDTVVNVIKKEAGDTTSFFKIKVNDDLPFVTALLETLASTFPQAEDGDRDWVLDANAAWSADTALRFADLLALYSKRIYMLEQPWPVEFRSQSTEAELRTWTTVKQRYNELGILVFADETMSTAADVPSLVPYADGVNVKLEKAGGFRGALAAITSAQANGMKLWCGMMVGSTLAASAAGHLIRYVTEGVDLDGSLLVTDESSNFSSGIFWSGRSTPDIPFGYIGWRAVQDPPGIGVLPKPVFL